MYADYKTIKSHLIIRPNQKTNPLISQEKLDLLKYISNNINKNITYIKTFFLRHNRKFGNQFIILNKVIFYCEILGCKRILLDKKYFWYIRNKIINEKYKMVIQTGNDIKYKNSITIIDKSYNFFHYTNIFKPEFSINILKKEILKNLPKININKMDLIIYIRSDDIFKKQSPNKLYSQPPFCFYKKILDYNKFNKIYIIAQNKFNPVINKLLNVFPNIIYNINDLKKDIIYILKAYNIVGAKSTFFYSLMQLNDNIKILWMYNFLYKDILDRLFKSFNSYKKNLITYIMNSSLIYKNKMQNWKNTKEQINLMLNEVCPNNFSIKKYFYV